MISVIGAGPAGIAAAIHLASEGHAVVLYERGSSIGGQIGFSSYIENMPPFALSGAEFRAACLSRLSRFGVIVTTGCELRELPDGPVLIATGLRPKLTGLVGTHVQSELDLVAQPGRRVVVVGGGNAAGQAAYAYARMGCEAVIVARRPLEEKMSHYLIADLRRLRVLFVCGEAERVCGDDLLWVRSCGHISIPLRFTTLHALVGLERREVLGPALSERGVRFTEHGYLYTDSHFRAGGDARAPIYAAGECVAGSIPRVTCAIGSANEAAYWLSREVGRK